MVKMNSGRRRIGRIIARLALPTLGIAALFILGWQYPMPTRTFTFEGPSSAECDAMRAEVAAGTLPSKVVQDPAFQCAGITPAAGVRVGSR